MTKTVVVGLDGAGFDLLDPWLEAGELPNLRRIVEGGTSGTLRSVLPPVTSPNWKAYSTGKNPGKLGIFWWYNVDVRNERVYRPSNRYHDHTEFWEIIAEREPVGVLGVPTTYPPKSVDSFVVAGGPDAENTGFASPASVEAELRDRFDYRVTNRYPLKEGTERAYEAVLDLVDGRFRAAKYLLSKYDLSFLQVTTFYINALHHNLWDHEYTLRGWKIIDDHLGEFLDAGHNLVLMSDHGHNEIRTVFRINRWLEREGYLAYDTRVPDALYRLGIHSDRLKRVLVDLDGLVPAVHLTDRVERLTPQWLIDRLPNDRGELGGSKASNADWDRTVAIASAQGPIYLTVDDAAPEYEELRAELVRKLEALTDPAGRPIADAVVPAEEIYDGEFLDEAPALVIDQAPGVHISEKIGSEAVFSPADDVWRGVNRREGFFAAIGPAFAAGTVEDLSILDLAPTLLHLHDHAIPTDMDGRVRKSLFAEGFDAKDRRVSRRSVA